MAGIVATSFARSSWVRSAAAPVVFFTACAVGEQPPEDAALGFDLDEDPSLLDDFEGKADGAACAAFPGGTLSGDDPLVLVSKQAGQQLSAAWAPRDLAGIEPALMMPGRQGELRGPALDALREMLAAAKAVDLPMGVRSAYRSYYTQCVTFAYKVQENGLAHAKRFSAEPGRSQHQLGTTADISAARLGWSLVQSMGETDEGLWLAESAHRFGFALSYPEGAEAVTGYAYEPWHYRYIGRDAAAEMHEAGLLLEEYLDRCQAGDPALACPREPFPEPIANDGFIGGACDADADCAGIGPGATCLTAYPGGYCTLSCSTYCPDRPGLSSPTFCVGEGEATLGACHSTCDDDVYPGNGCREGYACVRAHRPNSATAADVCLPAD